MSRHDAGHWNLYYIVNNLIKGSLIWVCAACPELSAQPVVFITIRLKELHLAVKDSSAIVFGTACNGKGNERGQTRNFYIPARYFCEPARG